MRKNRKIDLERIKIEKITQTREKTKIVDLYKFSVKHSFLYKNLENFVKTFKDSL